MAKVMTSSVKKTNQDLIKFKSPIFWRITAGVFASILIIEVALLIFSWFTERERLLTRLDESLITLTSLLDHDDPLPQLEQLINSGSSLPKYDIIGYLYESPEGSQHKGGADRTLSDIVDEKNPTHYSSEDKSYISYVTRSLDNGRIDKLWLYVDTSSISAYMVSYIWRILAMVLLISAFVTSTCLIFLTPLLINPLQRLNNLLVHGEMYGIRTANADQRDHNRADELGSVFRSFDKLRNELIGSEEDKTFITERFEEFANLGADCFWEVDKKCKITYVAGDVMRLLSVSPSRIKGMTYVSLINELSSRLPDQSNIIQTLKEKGKWQGEIQSSTPEIPACSVRIAATPIYDKNGRFSGIRGTINDISKEENLAKVLRYQASHDELTNLCNRRELNSRMSQSIAEYKNDGTVFTLLTLDLDRFKAVNDSCGHIAGDTLLKALAKIMLDSVRSGDTVARIGGDEFAVLLNGINTDIALSIAERLRNGIEDYRLIWEGTANSVSVSIGLAEVSPDLNRVESITFASDFSCISAKQSGKNQIRVYNGEAESTAINRNELLWVSRINHGIEENKFCLSQQAIARIDQRPDIHFEVLIRLQNEEGDIWTPNLFLPVAERNNLMPKIDQWVVTNALKWLNTQTIPDGTNYCMNINLSAASLADQGFKQFLIRTVEQNKQLNQYICFEMTESAAMLNPEETTALLMTLRTHGCRIALDDFGTGHSSLSQIRTLPLDYIKIDGTFIRDIHNSELDQTVVKSVAEIAKVLNIKTVAEFVDSDEALQLLGKLGIDYAQGYHISKPSPLENASAYIVTDRAA